MSAVDLPCYPHPPEKENGAGEMSCVNKLPPACDSSQSQIVANEILNDIFNNVFEILMSKTFYPDSKKISSNIVGDILGNIISTSPKSNDETCLLDDEIKQIIKDMKYPSEVNVKVCVKGTGDQIGSKDKTSIVTEQPKRNTLERKKRLTNLVRNSKQMLTKLVNNGPEIAMSKSDEFQETLIKVTDLQGNDSFVQAGSSSASDILQIPSEAGLDMIDLNGSKEMKVPGSLGRQEQLLKKEAQKSGSSHKTKWNFGARILKYLKRNKENKQETC